MNKAPEWFKPGIVVDEECSKLLNKSLLPEEIKYLIKLLKIDMITDEGRMKLIYYLDNQDKEIERLNNIITKLELYLINERINNWKVDEWTIMKIQNELEKLKEGK